jgi:hypothetical protein
MKCLYFENNTHGWGTPFINYLFIDFSSCQFCLKVYTEISREPSYQLLSGLLLGSFSLHFPVWLLFWFGLVLRVMFHFNENNKSIALKNFKIKVEVLATAPWIHSPPAPGSVLPVLTHHFCTWDPMAGPRAGPGIYSLCSHFLPRDTRLHGQGSCLTGSVSAPLKPCQPTPRHRDGRLTSPLPWVCALGFLRPKSRTAW